VLGVYCGNWVDFAMYDGSSKYTQFTFNISSAAHDLAAKGCEKQTRLKQLLKLITNKLV